jgi:hypothetical protein
MTLFEWGAKWGIPQVAIDDLQQGMGMLGTVDQDGASTESGSQQRIRLNAARAGELLWRNNVGACVDERGNFIRYGLANESKAMNEKVKSSDLIGVRPVIVTPAMVGFKVGIFKAVEVKKPGWVYKGTVREQAQMKFGEIVISHGGEFAFST